MKKADFFVAEGVAALKIHRDIDKRFEEVILRYLCDTFYDDYLGCEIEDCFIADKPEGEMRDDGVWYTSYNDYKNEIGGGIRYYPIEDSEKYIAVSYSF